VAGVAHERSWAISGTARCNAAVPAEGQGAVSRIETIGDATLYLGDCREILPSLGKVDAVVTDPPYSAQVHNGARTRIGKNGGADNIASINFSAISSGDFVVLCNRLVSISRRWVVMTCDWTHLAQAQDLGCPLVRMGIWVKPNSAPQFTGDRPATGWEAIGIFHRTDIVKRWNGGGARAVWNCVAVHGEHPTQKPIELVSEWVHLFSDEAETILDPFMGSGTTGVAAIKLGRKFIGIEIEPKYFDIACRRIEEATRQPDMFIEKPPPLKQGALEL